MGSKNTRMRSTWSAIHMMLSLIGNGYCKQDSGNIRSSRTQVYARTVVAHMWACTGHVMHQQALSSLCAVNINTCRMAAMDYFKHRFMIRPPTNLRYAAYQCDETQEAGDLIAWHLWHACHVRLQCRTCCLSSSVHPACFAMLYPRIQAACKLFLSISPLVYSLMHFAYLHVAIH